MFDSCQVFTKESNQIHVLSGFTKEIKRYYFMICKPGTDSEQPYYHQLFSKDELSQKKKEIRDVLSKLDLSISVVDKLFVH